MPTSDLGNIPSIVQAAVDLNPRSVLDLGVGFGKYGVLLREFLDINQGRIDRESWQVLLNGYEGFQSYRNPIHDLIYDMVWYKDFVADKLSLKDYDLVLMVDSLEHLERNMAEDLLEHLKDNNRNVIVSCPNGDYPQDAVNGNEYERHRSVWLGRDFVRMGGRMLYVGFCTVALFQGNSL